MKAYKGGVYSNDDAGNVIVFANNAKEAKKKVMGHHTGIADSAESYIDVYAVRDSDFDGMENLSQRELAQEQWRNGWWFDINGYPDCDKATDDEFYAWYDKNFD